METKYLHQSAFRDNVLELARRAESGMFNLVLIFGPTRSGKSTLAFQIGKEISEYLGVPFSVDNIEFDVQSLLDFLVGNQHYVGVLDEAAFEMKGEDWFNAASKKLRKYIDTAAKYNQTLIVCIPKIGELHKSLVTNYHARGIRTTIIKDTKTKDIKRRYRPGRAKAYKGNKLNSQFKGAKNDYDDDTLYKYSCTLGPFSFGPDLSFIDEEAYQAKKDAAIEKLSAEEEKKVDKNKERVANLCRYLNLHMDHTYEQIAELLKVSRKTVAEFIKLHKQLKEEETKK